MQITKKTKTSILLILIAMMATAFAIPLAQAAHTPTAIVASDSSGTPKHAFYVTDEIWVSITQTGSGNGPSVRLYVVNSDPSSASTLADVSGGYETVSLPNSDVSNQRVWTSVTTSGIYWVVLDKNKDGIYNTGDLKDSSSFSISKLAASTGLSLSVSSPQVYGSTLTGTATVTSGATGNVNFQVDLPGGGTSWVTYDTQPLVSGSATSAAYTLSAVGTYSFQSVYMGDTKYATSTSTTQTMVITRATPSLTVACDPLTVNKFGAETTTISGDLTSGSIRIQGANVIKLYYNDGTDHQIGTFFSTDSNGHYSYAWDVPPEIANNYYVIKAEFIGNTNYNGITAATSGSGNLLVVPEYLLGGLAALAACFVGFVAFKKRSSVKILKSKI
jgi:hypothetical protein